MPDIKALDRLKSQLQTTGLQQKNYQLYQLLSQLIDFLRQSVNLTTSSISHLESEVSAIPPTTTPGPSQIILGGHSVALDGEPGEIGPIGPVGLQGPIGPPGISTGRVFYFDPSDASDIAGYFTALGNPSANPETNIVNVLAGTGDTLIRSFVTEPNIPNVDDIPAGSQFTHIHGKVNGISEVARYKLEMYKCNPDGTAETLLRSGYSKNFSNTAIAEIDWDIYDFASYSIGFTQRLVFKLYVARVSGPANITVTTYFDGVVNPSYASTTISQGITGRQGPAGPPGMDAETIEFEPSPLISIPNYSEIALRTLNNRFLADQNIEGYVRPYLGVIEGTRTVPLGQWADVTFAAGNFTSSSGTWTVEVAEQITFAYTLIGTTMIVSVWIQNTDVSGGQSDLYITIPEGLSAANYNLATCQVRDNAAVTLGQMWTAAGQTQIRFRRYDNVNWAASAAQTDVKGTLAFEVQ